MNILPELISLQQERESIEKHAYESLDRIRERINRLKERLNQILG